MSFELTPIQIQEIDNKYIKAGFTKISNLKEVKEIYSFFSASRYADNLTVDAIRYRLAANLTKELIDQNMVSFHTHFDRDRFVDTVKAEVTICPPGTLVNSKQDEYFKVDDELFTEEEIINALKKTYPERLI